MPKIEQFNHIFQKLKKGEKVMSICKKSVDYEFIAGIMSIIFGWSVFAILEMCSNGIVKQGILAFSLSIGVAILTLVGGIYFDIKNIFNKSNKNSNDRILPRFW